jgi:hypothetical protein
LAGVKAFCKSKVEAEVFESTINADANEIAKEIIEKGPDTVSFSCYIWNITNTLEIAKQVKNALGCTVILGGPEVGFRPAHVLEKYPFVDFVLSGEGEESFPLLLDTLSSNGDLSKVWGLNYRSQNGIASVPEKEPMATPPSPYNDEFFKNLNGRISYFESSRGCPYRCAFCLSGSCSNLRFFDITQVKNDLIRLANSGTKTVKFVDRTFNADAKRADEILQFIKANYGTIIPKGVCFHFEIAGDILKETTLEILKSMPKGAVQLEIGMQSFNEETLKAINRKTNTKRLIENIKKLLSFENMHIHIDLIAGLKGEDIESFKRSFNIGFELNAHALQLGFLKLLHGADMREKPEQYPCEYSENPPYEVISTPWLSAEDIKKLKGCEDALDRLYNSGRFLNTIKFLIDEMQTDPFSLFCDFGNSLNGEGLSLKKYAEALYLHFKDRCDVARLRDEIVSDLLLCGSSEHIPDALKIYDPLYKKAKSLFKGDGKSIAILYSRDEILVVSKDEEKDFFGRFKGESIPIKDCVF